MTTYYAVFAAFAFLVVLLSTLPAAFRAVLGIAVLAGGLALMVIPWGRPKPAWIEAACDIYSADSEVIAGEVREKEKRILAWLEVAGCQPILYELPFDVRTAEQMQKALEEGAAGGFGTRLRFEPSLDRLEPKFYPAPQPPFPPKDRQPDLTIVPEEDA